MNLKKTVATVVAVAVLCSCAMNVKAQGGLKLENVVNEQFGTLLESLLKEGKIDEHGAKTYLETVFGHDQAVANYLSTVNLSQQISNIKQGTLSFDSYLSQINSSLISLIPAEKQQAYLNYMQTQMMIQGAMGEIFSGKVGANTVAMTSQLIEGAKQAKEEKAKKDAIAAKLELITPTLAKLNNGRAYDKLTITDEVDSDNNWVTNASPAVMENDKNKITSNKAVLQNGYLALTSGNYVGAIFNWDKETVFEGMRYYKNPQKFDFSRDFSMNLYVTVNKDANQLIIDIGKGYQLSLKRIEGSLILTTPIGYKATDKYGVLAHDNKQTRREVLAADKDKGYFHSIDWLNGNSLNVRVKKQPSVGEDMVLKLTVVKKGEVFTCQLNDIPVELKSGISYFPDKYYLGFNLKAINKKGVAQIHKLELQHL